MNRTAIIQGQKIVETTVSFFSKRTIESVDKLAVIQAKKLLKQRLDFK